MGNAKHVSSEKRFHIRKTTLKGFKNELGTIVLKHWQWSTVLRLLKEDENELNTSKSERRNLTKKSGYLQRPEYTSPNDLASNAIYFFLVILCLSRISRIPFLLVRALVNNKRVSIISVRSVLCLLLFMSRLASNYKENSYIAKIKRTSPKTKPLFFDLGIKE